MLYDSAKTARQLFFFFIPSLRLRGDHQRRQRRTQINYDLEDDPTSSDFNCVFLSRPVPRRLCLCAFTLQALFHISSHALKGAPVPKGSATVMGICGCTLNVNSQWQS